MNSLLLSMPARPGIYYVRRHRDGSGTFILAIATAYVTKYRSVVAGSQRRILAPIRRAGVATLMDRALSARDDQRRSAKSRPTFTSQLDATDVLRTVADAIRALAVAR